MGAIGPECLLSLNKRDQVKPHTYCAHDWNSYSNRASAGFMFVIGIILNLQLLVIPDLLVK